MKFTCNKKDLQKALAAVTRALPAKSTAPIFNCVYITDVDNRLELHASDLAAGIVAKIDADIIEGGAIAVPGKNLVEIVAKLPAASIEVAEIPGKNAVAFKADAAAFTLFTMNAEDFIPVKPQDFIHSFKVPVAVLKRLITRSTFAVGNDESRPLFLGCNIVVQNSSVSVAGTNTHRLIFNTADIEESVPGTHSVIVPAKSLNNLLTVISNLPAEDNVRIDFSEKHIAFSCTDAFVTCRLIDGKFPDVKAAIPASFDTRVVIDKAAFAAALNRAEVIAKFDNYNTVIFDFDNHTLNISATSAAFGNIAETLPAIVEGPAVAIAFNLKYIKDFLAFNVDSEEITISLNNKLAPAKFSFDGVDDSVYIVTPVRY